MEYIPISEILAELRIFDGKYKKEHVDAAIAQKDKIIPHLIQILENVLSNPKEYTRDENRHDHIYAFMLLGFFKETAAHNLIADIFSLKEGIPETLYGDLIREDLEIVLLNTCGGSLDRIKSMILDKELDVYCRISACRAFAYAVVLAYVSRQEVVEFFGPLFTVTEADKTSGFWDFLAATLADLYPVEIMDVITNAYESGLISSGFVAYKDFEQSLEMGEEKCLDHLRRNYESQRLDDFHKSISWWACFRKNSTKSSPAAIQSSDPFQMKKQKKSQKQKKAARQKRRQTKKSRKKNRR